MKDKTVKRLDRALWIVFTILLVCSITLLAVVIRDDIDSRYGGSGFSGADAAVFSDGGAATLRAERIEKSDEDIYEVSPEAEAGYLITPVVVSESGDPVDVAAWEWSCEWNAGDEWNKSSFSGDITRARDYGGNIWNPGGNPVEDYIEFETEGVIVTESGLYVDASDLYRRTGSSSVPCAVASVMGPFGTPVLYTLTVWDFAGNASSASVRFDYAAKTYSSSFEMRSGTQKRYETLFSGTYYMETGEIASSSDYCQISFSLASRDGASLFFIETDTEYTTGTLFAGGGGDDVWRMEIEYEDATVCSYEALLWADASNALFGTENGLSDAPNTVLRYSSLRVFDRSIYPSCDAMMTLYFIRETPEGDDAVFSTGLSFSDYDQILVAIDGVELQGSDGERLEDIVGGTDA